MNPTSHSLSTIPPLITEQQIHARVRELAEEMIHAYPESPPLLLGLMNGSIFFLVDLIRQLPSSIEVDCWRVWSYDGSHSTGTVRGLEHCSRSFENRQVVIVDDILDTGQTLRAVRQRVLQLQARSVEICVLLRKQHSRLIDLEPRWIGFDIPDVFVVGYGLDCNGQYRGLPYIGKLEPSLPDSMTTE